MDPERIAVELEKLSTKLDERERGANDFRAEIRDGFVRVGDKLDVHAKEDTRRFEMAAVNLDVKVNDLYVHIDRKDDERRKRGWQVAGLVITTVLGIVGVIVSLYKSGLL